MTQKQLLLPLVLVLACTITTSAQVSVQCGTDLLEETYCYGPNEDQTWSYQAVGTGTLKLEFIRGTIQAGASDQLWIHDGPDASAPLLFAHTQTGTWNLGPPGSNINNTFTNFHSIELSSTSGQLFMRLVSNGTTQCSTTGTYDPWEWRVFCFDCVEPQAQASVVEDCDAQTFQILLDVISTGDGPTVSAIHSTNGGAPQTVAGIGTGSTLIGPFPLGATVDLTVAHASEFLCDLSLGEITDSGLCPLDIICGAPPVMQEYCYGPNEDMGWVYEAVGTGTLKLEFIRGTIQSGASDQLWIHDGPDASAPLLFVHTQTGTWNLGPPGSNVNNTFTNFHSVEVFSTSGQLFMRLQSNGTTHCGTTATYDPWEWRVYCFDCVVPDVQASVVEDCDAQNFQILLDVISTGDGPTVSAIHSTDGGAPQTVSGLGTGSTTIGPFPLGSVVSVEIAHASDALCGLSLGEITDSGICPLDIICGAPPVEQEYCYGPNEDMGWLYEAQGGGTLKLTFIRGTIQTGTSDQMWIHDGPDASAPLLFAHTQTGTWNLGPPGSNINNTFTNFHSIEVLSNSGQIFMRMESNATTQCSTTGTYDPWEWEVVCMDCQIPQVTPTVVEDCDAGTFQIALDVITTGDGATVDITYTADGGSPQTLTGLTTGVTTIGPFPMSTVVNVGVDHATNFLCDISLGNITDSGICPVHILCGGPALEETYCYSANDDMGWLYQADGTGTLRLVFQRGTIQSHVSDRLWIHDGPDASAPLLFAHTQTGTWNLGPPGSNINNTFTNFHAIVVTSTTGQIFMRMESNGTVQCGTTATYDQWEWMVMCLDCVPASADMEIIQDCDQFQYSVEVDVTSFGTSGNVTISNDVDLDPVTLTAPGITTIGPIESGESVNIVLEHDANPLCNFEAPTLVNPVCPLYVCSALPVEETYCYGPNEEKVWSYAAPGDGNIRVVFQRGTIQTMNSDQFVIYDGPDDSSPILFSHTNTTTSNLGPAGSSINNTFTSNYGVDVVSTGTNLYMVLTTNATVQCGTTSTYDPWAWTVQCAGCEAPGVSYLLIPDCEHRQFGAQIEITEMAGPSGFLLTGGSTGVEHTAMTPGIYEFGNTNVDQPMVFTVADLDIANCIYMSDTMTLASDSCVYTTCDPITFTHCYGNNENRWYTYQSIGATPITIAFLEGHMLPSDRIFIYNGTSEVNTAVLFQGNNNQNLAGVTYSSINATNTLTLRIQSNGSASCEDGQSQVPLHWVVGCAPVGIGEHGSSQSILFPNPVVDLITVEFSQLTHERVTVRVFDMSGRVVLDEIQNIAGGRMTVDPSGLQNGQYILQISTDDQIVTHQFQLMR